jgi:hypothetical protein
MTPAQRTFMSELAPLRKAIAQFDKTGAAYVFSWSPAQVNACTNLAGVITTFDDAVSNVLLNMVPMGGNAWNDTFGVTTGGQTLQNDLQVVAYGQAEANVEGQSASGNLWVTNLVIDWNRWVTDLDLLNSGLGLSPVAPVALLG